MSTGNEHLQIMLAKDLTPPAEGLYLLVAFRFGSNPDDEDHPAVAETYLRPVSHDSLYECWWIAEPVNYRVDGNLRIAECEDYAIVIRDCLETADDDLESLTYESYRELMTAVRSTDHKKLAKAWNYLGSINEGDGDLERYRRFSAGRAKAFLELNVGDDIVPTGTGVGTIRDLGLTIIALASKHPLELAENPRQLSAFNYPRQYGPSSPKFARCGYVTNDKHSLYLLSGTAAIVGHESLHPHEIDSQLDETLRNLEALSGSVSMLDKSSVLRVYLRSPDDAPFVSGKLKAEFGISDDQVVFLHGHICRRELVIEIDGVRVQ
jgi:chorismate lyase/3-hydroxybenzoate synthase